METTLREDSERDLEELAAPTGGGEAGGHGRESFVWVT
jgi:hypothetical protein